MSETEPSKQKHCVIEEMFGLQGASIGNKRISRHVEKHWGLLVAWSTDMAATETTRPPYYNATDLSSQRAKFYKPFRNLC